MMRTELVLLVVAFGLLTLFMYSSVMEVLFGLITYGWIKIYFSGPAVVGTSRTLRSCMLFWMGVCALIKRNMSACEPQRVTATRSKGGW